MMFSLNTVDHSNLNYQPAQDIRRKNTHESTGNQDNGNKSNAVSDDGIGINNMGIGTHNPVDMSMYASSSLQFTHNRLRQGLSPDVLSTTNIKYLMTLGGGHISAPASVENSDDYFLFVGIESQQDSKNNGSEGAQNQWDCLERQRMHLHPYLVPNSAPKSLFGDRTDRENTASEEAKMRSLNLRRSSSSLIPIRGTQSKAFSNQHQLPRSNLSTSHSDFSLLKVAGMSPNRGKNIALNNSSENKLTLSVYGGESSGNSNQTTDKKSRNPGFYLKLDNLRPKQRNIVSPSSATTASSFTSSYMSPWNVESRDSDLSTPLQAKEFKSPSLAGFKRIYFYPRRMNSTMSQGSNIEHAQDTITPLMFPPQTDNCDYFGDIKSSSQHERRESFPLVKQSISFHDGNRSIEQPVTDDLDVGSSIYFNFDEFQVLNINGNCENYKLQEVSFFGTQKVDALFTSPLYGDSVSAQPTRTGHSALDHAPSHHELTEDGSYLQGQQNFSASPYDCLPDQQQPPHQMEFYEDPHNKQQLIPTQDPHSYLRFYGDQKFGALDENGSDTAVVYEGRQTEIGGASIAIDQTLETGHEATNDVKSTGKRKQSKGAVCTVCDRHITRDYSRHMRIHDEAGRFQCVFPPGYCTHKSRKFNRPYDYKKHLLNMHFRFEDVTAKLAPNLTEKLNVGGHCTTCGLRFVASDWLENHILSNDANKRCFKLQQME